MSYASRRSIVIERRLQLLGFICFVGVAAAAALGFIGDRARIVAHSATIYLLLLLIFRIAGRRTLAETSTFDLVLLLIIGETTQQVMVGDDDTVPGAAIAIVSLVSLDMAIGYLKNTFPAFDRLLEGRPVLLVREGKIQHAAMQAHSTSRSASNTESSSALPPEAMCSPEEAARSRTPLCASLPSMRQRLRMWRAGERGGWTVVFHCPPRRTAEI